MKSKTNELLEDTAITVICQILHVDAKDIEDIAVLKKGMTNRSFIFQCKGKRYIIRISGAGTEKLIDRYQEKEVYETIRSKDICDPVIYVNPEKGYKITEFLEHSRVCDPADSMDVKKCMQFLRSFHNRKLVVNHEFDIFGQIEKYEKLLENTKSKYEDYEEIKKDVYFLKHI